MERATMMPPTGRDDHDDMHKKIRLVVGLGVSARQLGGKDDDTIRREVLEQAVKAMKKHARDEFEQETFVAIAQREIDRLLDGGQPIARSVLVD